MHGKGAKFGFVLLLLMLVLIVTLHYLSIHIHTEHTNENASMSHNSLKVQALEVSRKRASEPHNQFPANSSLHQLHEDLLKLREKLRNNEFYRSSNKETDSDKDISKQKLPINSNNNAALQPESINAATTTKQAINIKRPSKAVIFTMDTIPSYEENSRYGGASGELIIRYALEEAFKENGVSLHIVRSDPEFDRIDMKNFDIILLDSWTWAGKGWVPKRNIRGHEKKIYILDFFGTEKLRGNSLHLPPRQILTAFKSPWNSFLGYYIHPERIEKLRPFWEKKQQQGVIWGKDPKHYDGKHELLEHIAGISKLISTSTVQVERHANIEWVGHLTSDQWFEHLARSKFLLGLGNPLLGPSAVDAVSLGCMFIDPIYKTPAHTAKYISQHPYLHETMPEYVCTYKEGDAKELAQCVERALSTNLSPKIPDELTRESYMRRVKDIFGL